MRNEVLLKLVFRLNVLLNTVGIGRVQAFRHLKHIFWNLLGPKDPPLITIHGCKMYVPANVPGISHYILAPYEPHTTELFERFVTPGVTVLDLGAQFGYFSVIAARKLKGQGRVYAFEPIPANVGLLEKNLALNGCTNVTIVPKAVGNSPSVVTMKAYEASTSHGTLHPLPGMRVKDSIPVECVTIDGFLQGQPVDIIKMDIEGNEPYALEGMRETVRRSPALIMFAEFSPGYLRQAGVKPRDYVRQLESMGFDLQVIDEERRCLCPVTGAMFEQNDPFWKVNLLCARAAAAPE
ncbi:MAG: FkbM family methyltransferase [Chloroflexi bacterium]|nr:FkbM family methyltransferase [Chloroflexota bacterium]